MTPILLLLLATAAALTVGSVTNRRRSPAMTAAVVAVVFGHFMVMLVTSFWTFVTPRDALGWDVAFVAFTLLTLASYALNKGECVFNVWERRLYEPGYVAGSAPGREAYVLSLPLPMQVIVVTAWFAKLLVVYLTFDRVLGAGRRRPASAVGVTAVLVYVLYTAHFWMPSGMLRFLSATTTAASASSFPS
jgi:hypothetical protein